MAISSHDTGRHHSKEHYRIDMPTAEPNLQTLRARKARLARSIGKTGYRFLLGLAIVGAAAGGTFYAVHLPHFSYFSIAIALACLMLAVWYNQDLLPLAANGKQ